MRVPTKKMNVSVFLCVLFLTTAPAAAVQQGRSSALTAREAVVFALQNSPDSGIAEKRMEAADAARREAASAFYPRLNLNAGYSQTDNPMYSFGNILNQGSFDNTIDFNNPGRTDNLNMQAEIRYRLYSGGGDSAGLSGAEAAVRATAHDREAVRNRLGFEVIRAFQDIVLARKQVEARAEEERAIEASLHVARARFEAGDLLKTEVLNFEVQKARASENLIVSRHQLDLSEKVLLNLLGLQAEELAVDHDAPVEQDVPQPGTYRERPEVAALKAQLERAAAEIDRARAAQLPTLDGFASYQYDYGFVLDDGGDSWTAGLQLTYNLYDGRRTSAAIAAKQAAYDELRKQLDKLELGIRLDVQKAELNYRQAIERVEVTRKMVETAQESAQLSRERFKEGVILSSDLIETEVRLTDALLRQSAAESHYLTAIADVRRAAGYQQFAPTTEALLEASQ